MRPVNQPALVADRDEALALGIEPQRPDNPPKPRNRGGQDESAAIFEFAEPHARPVAGVERGQRPGIDLDRDRRGDREFVGNGRLRRPLNGGLRAAPPRDSAATESRRRGILQKRRRPMGVRMRSRVQAARPVVARGGRSAVGLG